MAKQAVEAPRTNVFLIPPEDLKLITDEKHPLYDPRVEQPVREGLVLSMMANGFQSVITAFKDGDDMIVTTGRGRTKAAREANKRLKKQGKELLKCMVMFKRGSEPDHYGMALVENTNRMDESDLSLAKKLQRLVTMGRTEDEAGATCGLDKAQTKTIFALLGLAAPVQRAVEKGQISTTAAAKLAPLEKTKQVEELEDLLKESGGKRVRVTKVAARVKKARGGSGLTPPGRKQVKGLGAWVATEGVGKLPEPAKDVLKWILSGTITGCVKDALAGMEADIKAKLEKKEADKKIAAEVKAKAEADAKLAAEAKKEADAKAKADAAAVAAKSKADIEAALKAADEAKAAAAKVKAEAKAAATAAASQKLAEAAKLLVDAKAAAAKAKADAKAAKKAGAVAAKQPEVKPADSKSAGPGAVAAGVPGVGVPAGATAGAAQNPAGAAASPGVVASNPDSGGEVMNIKKLAEDKAKAEAATKVAEEPLFG
jgi:hypothetical protein